MNTVTGYIPGLRKRKVEEEAAEETPTSKRARVSEAEITPRSRPSPQKGKMRSVKNPAVPSSLSTITEYSEPSTLLDAAPDTTPSKRRLPQPEPLPHHTPSSLPRHLPQSTPLRRRIADVRAKKEELSVTPARRYAWEKKPAMQLPKEKNADARLAKMQALHDAKQKVAQLSEDPDVKDVMAHSYLGRKRVKIDNLAVIPHHRPGESSSTFRVPDYDSDEEISVDGDAEEISNVFEEQETVQDVPQEQTPVQPQQAQPQPQLQPQQPAFMFPSVGAKPPTYHVSREFQEQAGAWFGQGLAGFVPV